MVEGIATEESDSGPSDEGTELERESGVFFEVLVLAQASDDTTFFQSCRISCADEEIFKDACFVSFRRRFPTCSLQILHRYQNAFFQGEDHSHALCKVEELFT